jgi:lysophospholipase L1-like esterase
LTLIENNALVLFQGDSITDAGRVRQAQTDLGSGYAMLVASWFTASYPEKMVRFLNRGIGGNRAVDLQERWQRDCLDLRPTWVSIMIGINDTWRRYDSGAVTSVAAYEASYRDILERTKQQLNARLVLCEPFVLPVPKDRLHWREDLDPKIEVVQRLAQEFEAILVPLDRIFVEAATKLPAAQWAGDGVHPSQSGHALIAQAWLRAVQAL